MSDERIDWQHLRDLNPHFGKPKKQPELSGDARTTAWHAITGQGPRRLARFNARTGIKPDGAHPKWDEVRVDGERTRAAFHRRVKRAG